MPTTAKEILDQDDIEAFTGLGLALLRKSARIGYALLSQPERLFYAVYSLDMDINNGGFYGYFTNPTGDTAPDALTGLRAMGAEHTAGILARATSVFPGSVVPVSQADRELFLNPSSGDKWADLGQPNRFEAYFRPLDQEYWGSDEPVIHHALAYARKHVQDFEL